MQHYLNDEAVAACPPSRAYRLRKFARRNKAVLGTTAVVAGSLIAGIIGTSWQMQLAGEERDRAVMAEANALQEKERAIEAEQSAEKRLKIASALNEFINDDLLGMGSAWRQAERGLSPDPNIKLRTLLDRAATNIKDRFLDQPFVEAAVRDTLGSTYWAIGAYDEAQKQFQRALELNRQQLGEEHADTIESMLSLAIVYVDQGHYAEAENLYEKALKISRRKLGDEHADTLRSTAGLCVSIVSNPGTETPKPCIVR